MARVRSRPTALVLLLVLAGGCSSGRRIGINPPQPALDIPGPAEPTPTRASHRLELCEGQPCLNGGSCLALPSANNPGDTFDYTCSCSQGFTGGNCEVRAHRRSVFASCMCEYSTDWAALREDVNLSSQMQYFPHHTADISRSLSFAAFCHLLGLLPLFALLVSGCCK